MREAAGRPVDRATVAQNCSCAQTEPQFGSGSACLPGRKSLRRTSWKMAGRRPRERLKLIGSIFRVDAWPTIKANTSKPRKSC
jgi:hypothetical protein